MSDLHELIRSAVEKQGKADPEAVLAADETVIPSDEEAWRIETGRLPEMDDGVETRSTLEAEQLALDAGADAPGKYQRHGQARTSAAAAYEATPITGKARLAVLECIAAAGAHGATDEEIQAALDMNPSTQRPRRVELVEEHAVEDSGYRRRTDSGREAVVWTVTPRGLEALA